MHRRRSRERRAEKPRAPVPAPAPAAKRRAREGAVVPDELRVSKGRESSGNVVLVTGFECFGGEKMNPSWEICKRLPREIAGLRVETCLVPCEFRRAIEVVAEAIERHRPSIILSLGLAGGRNRLGVERVAINVDDARIPDNAGARPIDEAIAAKGPPAYFATIPVKAVTRAIRAAGVPVEVSNSAGTYVCNHLMYGVLHFVAASGNGARAGFVHVPYAEEQVIDKKEAPAMSFESMTRGVVAGIEAAVGHRSAIVSAEGSLD